MPAKRAFLPLVPLVLVALASCYETHEASGRPDGGVDAGVDGGVDSALRDSARPRLDATPMDATVDAADTGPLETDASAPLCEIPRGEASVGNLCALTPTGTFPAGEPLSLPIVVDVCACDETPFCTARVWPGRIELTTTVCSVGEVCDLCGTTGLRCETPPLRAGDYRVDINGDAAMQITVAPRRVADPARPVCWTSASGDPSCGWPPRPSAGAGVACHAALSDVGSQPVIAVVYDCAPCDSQTGGCEVQLDDGTLFVRPRLVSCDDGDCEGCEELRVVCQPPPLAAGDYLVEVEGAGMPTRLRVRDILPGTPTEDVCVDL